MEGENDLINVLSMDNISNRDVTAYYMDTIYKAAQEYGSANRFDFSCLPEKDSIVIVSTVIEALKLLCKGYKKVGIWIQGVLPEESYLKHQSKIRKKILEYIERLCISRAVILFMVSKEMLRHYEKKYNLCLSDKTVIMPCFNTTIDPEAFDDSERYDKNIFTYVGSLAPWQCFTQTIELYSKLEQVLRNAELKIFTPDIEAAERICKEKIKNYSIEYVSNSELQEKLRRIKFGFILREDNIVNQVATPTKFSSYLANGVIPIFSKSIRSFDEESNEMEYVLRLESFDDTEKVIDFCNKGIDIKQIQNEYRELFDSYYCPNRYVRIIKSKFQELHLA